MAGNIKKWCDIFSSGGPRNHYPHSYVVSWYFKNVRPSTRPVKSKKILDIGCGTAPDLFLFVSEGFEYYGLDVTDNCFRQIEDVADSRNLDRSRIHLKLFSPPLLPFKSNTFDAVIGLESLHFNTDPKDMKKIIAEVSRVLKKNGHFIFTTINRKHYFIVSGKSDFISDSCLEIGQNFPERERAGLKYYVFKGEGEIKGYFKKFARVTIGEYLLDTCDGKPDAYYMIFGKK